MKIEGPFPVYADRAMITPRNIERLAGLLEGEGSFQWCGEGRSLGIVLAMNDRDVVEWASRILSGSSVASYSNTKTNNPIWKTAVYGGKAAGWMMTLYGLLGIRRRTKIRELLAEWMTRPGPHGRRKKVPRSRDEAGRFISYLR